MKGLTISLSSDEMYSFGSEAHFNLLLENSFRILAVQVHPLVSSYHILILLFHYHMIVSLALAAQLS